MQGKVQLTFNELRLAKGMQNVKITKIFFISNGLHTKSKGSPQCPQGEIMYVVCLS